MGRWDDIPVEQRTATHTRLPSMVEGVAWKYKLTYAEAERVLDLTDDVEVGPKVDEAAAKVIAERTVKRPVQSKGPVGSADPQPGA